MKILMINYEFPPLGGGGAQAHYQLLQDYAGREGLEVDVLTSATGEGFWQEYFSNRITLYKIGLEKKNMHLWRKGEMLAWLWRAKKHYRLMLKQNDYDLVHAFFGFPSGWLCYRTAGKAPYMISLRGSDVPGINPRVQLEYKLLGWIFRRIWRKSSLLVACSEGLRERALRFLPSAEIDVIPNGVDLKRFEPGDGRIEGRRWRLLTVGRLSASKRTELLIEAVDLLRASHPEITLTIAGGGALMDSLQPWAREKGLSEVIRFLGVVSADKMPGLYQEHDILVSATAQEGMSNAMLEGMACGMPIVTTRCEGVEELIGDNGVIVEEPSAAGLAEAVRGLLEDGQVYDTMAAAARKRAEEFTWGVVAEEYIKCYEKIIEIARG